MLCWQCFGVEFSCFWSFFSPFEAINCGKPELPDHGSVSGFSTRYPHPITFTCDIGYEIQGSVVRRCQANGTWSGNKTSCKRKCQHTFKNLFYQVVSVRNIYSPFPSNVLAFAQYDQIQMPSQHCSVIFVAFNPAGTSMSWFNFALCLSHIHCRSETRSETFLENFKPSANLNHNIHTKTYKTPYDFLQR